MLVVAEAVIVFTALIVSYWRVRPALTPMTLGAWIAFVIAYWEGLLISFRLLRSIRRLRGSDEQALDNAIRQALVVMSLFYVAIFFAWYAAVALPLMR